MECNTLGFFAGLGVILGVLTGSVVFASAGGPLDVLTGLVCGTRYFRWG